MGSSKTIGAWGRRGWCRSSMCAVAALAAVGCGGEDAEVPVIDITTDDRIPIATAYLDRSYRDNGGLLIAAGADGYPVWQGPDVDRMVVEARRFYDTLGAPGAQPRVVDYPDPFTGEVGNLRTTAPLSFEEWKRTFGFPEPSQGETRSDWRKRVGAVIYYNENELGLGRELACSEFPDGSAADGSALTGIACFVTNYGAAFSDIHNSLRVAEAGAPMKNTVAITYRPSLGKDYEVQFYVYGREGRRQEWAQLDTLGPRPAPQVCANCHGGFYDEQRHLMRLARFLPIDPSVVRFAESPPEVTRAAQEDQFRALNALALRTNLTGQQRALFAGMYGGEPERPGRVSEPWAPEGWSDTPAHRELYLQAVKPYCGTCHMAVDQNAAGMPSPTYAALDSFAAMSRSSVWAYVCAFQMPNAQPTMHELWRVRSQPLTIGGRQYPSAADALLHQLAGGDRGMCRDLDRQSDCRRGPVPDRLCGDDHSGTACNPDTGRCVPVRGFASPTDPAAPNGVCRMDGSRGCPWPQECRQVQSTALSGYDGACFGCDGVGQPACLPIAGTGMAMN